MSLIDPVHDVVGMFITHDQAEAAGTVQGISLRVPVARLRMINAMASYAETSRNVMANQLLKAGISVVMSQLPPTVREEILDDLAEVSQREGDF